MTTAVALAAMLAAAAAVVFAPLLSRRHDRHVDGGAASDGDARLRLEIEGLEEARAEGKLGAEAMVEERDRVMREAGEARSSESSPTERQARRYPRAAVAGFAMLMVAGVTVAMMVERQDLTLDIGQMVAGLESRVAEGDYTREDLRMLARSYNVTGRGEEVAALLRSLHEANPDEAEAALALAEAVRAVPGGQQEAAALYEGVLRRDPQRLEALQWLAVIRVVEGRGEEAVALLNRLEPLTAGDEEAMEAMNVLRRMLEERMGDGG